MKISKKDYDVPIEHGRNLGEYSGKLLRSAGIDNLGKLKELGWEEACLQVVANNPESIHLNLFTSIIGAIFNKHWQEIDPLMKSKAKEMTKALKKSL